MINDGQRERSWIAAAIRTASIAAGAFILALLLSSCAYLFIKPPPGFCATAGSSPIRDFCIVTPHILWEGERPTAVRMEWLLMHGVGSIVSIQVDDRAAFRATRPPAEMAVSIPYFRIRRFNAIRLLSREDLDERVAAFLAIMSKAPKPVYLHCRLGVDRALILAAAYRVLIQGLDPEQAVKDLRGLHSPWLPAEVRYLHSLTPARRAKILKMVEYWKPRVGARADIRCLQGRCQYLSTVGVLGKG